MGGYFDDDDSAEEFFEDLKEFDYDDHKMEIIGAIMGFVIIFLICTCCGMACRKKREGAIFSTPVVVVSEQHTSAATGPYPVTVQHHNTAVMNPQATYPMPQPGMQMPMPGGYPQYPPAGGAGQAPYPTNAPYPTGMTQPVAMPMPQNPATMNPPSYNEVVGSEAYQKQAPYNPNFSS